MVITWHKTFKEVQCRAWNAGAQPTKRYFHPSSWATVPLLLSIYLRVPSSPVPHRCPPFLHPTSSACLFSRAFLFSRAILCVVHCFIKLRGVQAPCSALCQFLPCPGTFCKTWWGRLGSLLISFTAKNGDSHFSSKPDLNNKMSHHVRSLAHHFFPLCLSWEKKLPQHFLHNCGD